MDKQEKFVSGFIGIAGQPNAGKSSIINSLMQEKVVIVSSKPQTTRNSIRCIYTDQNMQAIFIDTPGLLNPESELDAKMMDSMVDALEDIDIFMYLLEPGKKPGESDLELLKRIEKQKIPVYLVLTKNDIVSKKGAVKAGKNGYHDSLREQISFSRVVKCSSKTKKGLTEIVEALKEDLPEGPMYYPYDQMLDSNERFLITELIREKILCYFRNEVPHSVAVAIAEMKDRPDGLSVIHADIYVEQPSQKRIIIGKNGEMLKKIGMNSRKEIEKVLGRRCYLELWVRVRKKWRKDKRFVKELIDNEL
jgi:GTP-binding protein Era